MDRMTFIVSAGFLQNLRTCWVFLVVVPVCLLAFCQEGGVQGTPEVHLKGVR